VTLRLNRSKRVFARLLHGAVGISALWTQACGASVEGHARNAALSYVRYPAMAVAELQCVHAPAALDAIVVPVRGRPPVVFSRAGDARSIAEWVRARELFIVHCPVKYDSGSCYAVTVRCPQDRNCYVVGDTFDNSCDAGSY